VRTGRSLKRSTRGSIKMAKVRLVHADKTRSYGFVLVPEQHVPQVLRQGDKVYALRNTQGERLVFEEVECLDVLTEDEFERAKQEGLLT
jgi:hypothetical protein